MTPQIIFFFSLTAFVDDEYIFDKVQGMKKKSERKRIILVESNLWSSPSPTSCSEYALLEDVALSHIQLGSKCLQGWRFQSISGKLLPVFDHPHSASISSLLFSKTLALLQLKISFPSKGSSKSRKKHASLKYIKVPEFRLWKLLL